MVWEERFYAEPKDVLAIRIVCTECEASLSFPFGATNYVPERCPYCPSQWFSKGSMDLQKVNRLIDGIKGLRERGNDSLCKIAMELRGDLKAPDDK